MKFLLTSDIHLHPWPAFSTINENGLNSRLKLTCDRVRDMSNMAADLGCVAVLFAGDLFHTKRIEAETIDCAVRAFAGVRTRWVGVPGNHDQATHGPDGRHSARAISAIQWLDLAGGRSAFFEKDGEKISVYGIPYIRSREELKREIEESPKCDILLMHAGFAGAFMGSDYIADLGDCADPEWVYGKKFKLVVTGHFHMPQVIMKAETKELGYDIQKPTNSGQYTRYREGETIVVPGSPEAHNWGDQNSARGCWILDTTERSLTFHKLSSPEFVEVRVTADAERAKGNYVRVPECCEADPGLMKRLEQEACGVAVEFESVVAAKPMRGYEVGAGDRPEDVLQKYVQAADTKLDRKALLEAGRRFIG